MEEYGVTGACFLGWGGDMDGWMDRWDGVKVARSAPQERAPLAATALAAGPATDKARGELANTLALWI